MLVQLRSVESDLQVLERDLGDLDRVGELVRGHVIISAGACQRTSGIMRHGCRITPGSEVHTLGWHRSAARNRNDKSHGLID